MPSRFTPSGLDVACAGLPSHLDALQAGGNTLRSLVGRTTESGVMEIELPPYKEVCASKPMCLYGIEVSPPSTTLPSFDVDGLT